MKQFRVILLVILITVAHSIVYAQAPTALPVVQEYRVPAGSGPHDVAPDPTPDGKVWFTAQRSGSLGWLDPTNGKTGMISLGAGSAPHGVIVGPDGAPWITDGGQNAIVRVDPKTDTVTRFPLPGRYANLNTAAFDKNGILWFTGQAGRYGRLDPRTGKVEVFDAPKGTGPYGITSISDGSVFYASLAGSYLGQINPETRKATVLEPPTPNQGTRRVWADSLGRIWTSQWNVGQIGLYIPESGQWKEWKLPGAHPAAYAVYVDENDKVWVSDWGSNALVRFDPETEQFTAFTLPTAGALVRQILGRPGEIWAAESAVDKLIVIRTVKQPTAN